MTPHELIDRADTLLRAHRAERGLYWQAQADEWRRKAAPYLTAEAPPIVPGDATIALATRLDGWYREWEALAPAARPGSFYYIAARLIEWADEIEAATA